MKPGTQHSRPPVEYDRQTFEHGDIILTISIARVDIPWVTLAVGRKSRDPAKPSSWVQWEQIDAVVEALAALKQSEIGRQCDEHTETLAARRAKRNGNFRNVWNDR